MNVGQLITDIMRREGWDKFTNRPADRGGPTKFGITQKTLSSYLGRPASVDDVKSLTEPVARSIYFTMYVRGPGFGSIRDNKLMMLAVDCGVNHGQQRAIKWLQEIVGVRVDGVLGPVTAEAINKASAEALFKKLNARRVRFYGEIVTADWKRALEKARKTPGLEDDLALSQLQAMFAHGWLNRAAEFIEM